MSTELADLSDLQLKAELLRRLEIGVTGLEKQVASFDNVITERRAELKAVQAQVEQARSELKLLQDAAVESSNTRQQVDAGTLKVKQAAKDELLETEAALQAVLQATEQAKTDREAVIAKLDETIADRQANAKQWKFEITALEEKMIFKNSVLAATLQSIEQIDRKKYIILINMMRQLFRKKTSCKPSKPNLPKLKKRLSYLKIPNSLRYKS